jgi:transmembrane sensor
MSGAINDNQLIREMAVQWAIETREPDFDDWDGFTAWLEADSAHGQAYDEVQFSLGEADTALAQLPAPSLEQQRKPTHDAVNDNPPGWFARRSWLGGAIAATLLLALSSVLLFSPRGVTYYSTSPGETRLIPLADGSTVELAGDSRIALEGERMARLEAGQALFTIRHDEANPFVLMAAGDRLIDAGTVFDVRLVGERLDLSVAEGAVIVNPTGQNLKVAAGARAVRGGDGRYRLGSVAPDAVGEWARGRISFENASLYEIARELSRATGRSFFSADKTTRLSGSIAVEAVRDDPRAVEALLGARVRMVDEKWELEVE